MRRIFVGLSISAIVVGIVAACGGSNGTTVETTGGGGALCGPNGTNACGARKCDANLGCVECLADADCPAAERACITGRCEVCRTNAECGATSPTPACWPGDHKCHP